jgi:hypothetical protein
VSGQLHRRCAWCGLWLREGRWVALPPGQEPRDDELNVSHGMCPSCADVMDANITAADDAEPPTDPDPAS